MHISCHRVLNQELVCNLINSHKHQSQFTSSSILLLFGCLKFCSLSLALNLQFFLVLVEVLIFLFFMYRLLLDFTEFFCVEFSELSHCTKSCCLAFYCLFLRFHNRHYLLFLKVYLLLSLKYLFNELADFAVRREI